MAVVPGNGQRQLISIPPIQKGYFGGVSAPASKKTYLFLAQSLLGQNKGYFTACSTSCRYSHYGERLVIELIPIKLLGLYIIYSQSTATALLASGENRRRYPR